MFMLTHRARSAPHPINMSPSSADDDDASLPNAFSGHRRHSAITTTTTTVVSHLGDAAAAAGPRSPWRLLNDRQNTAAIGLIACLNIRNAPPDLLKIEPCARLECWTDPLAMPWRRAIDQIGRNLLQQYERLDPHANHTMLMDPAVEDVQKLCVAMRQHAQQDRVLLHYNGHGVPQPTRHGELWVFDAKQGMRFVPVSMRQVWQWLGGDDDGGGAPTIYVFDCSNAGVLVEHLDRVMAGERETEHGGQQQEGADGEAAGDVEVAVDATPPAPDAAPEPEATAISGPTNPFNCIVLAACAAGQLLPTNPDLPADLFTSCLTTPILMSARWSMLKPSASFVPHIPLDLIQRMPGEPNDRRSMLGHLTWIFNAITDTIAWSQLPADQFRALFCADPLVASLFRNYLLAESLMRNYDCTPVSRPALPSCRAHPLWSCWELIVSLAVQKLPDIVHNGAVYSGSEDHLTAFEEWLLLDSFDGSPPDLPILLHVLLSSDHRLRALELLARFCCLGTRAVQLALGAGIASYVLRLLQSSDHQQQAPLVVIWAKIMAVDPLLHVDLIERQGHKFFVNALKNALPSAGVSGLSAHQLAHVAFVLAACVQGSPFGKLATLNGRLIDVCLAHLVHITAVPQLLRQWLTICVGNLWKGCAAARWTAVRDRAQEKLYPLLGDERPEVRAAAVYALGTLMSTAVHDRPEHADIIDRTIGMQLLTAVGHDMCPMVRMELIAAVQWMVVLFERQFIAAYLHEDEERRTKQQRLAATVRVHGIIDVMYSQLWSGLNALACDPHPGVASRAQRVVDFVVMRALAQIADGETEDGEPLTTVSKTDASTASAVAGERRQPELEPEPPEQPKQQLRIVTTDFIAKYTALWSMATHSGPRPPPHPSMTPDDGSSNVDPNALANLQRQARMQRNDKARRSAVGQLALTAGDRLATLQWRARTMTTTTPQTPRSLCLHPFEQQLAVASQHGVHVHDWPTSTIRGYAPEAAGSDMSQEIAGARAVMSPVCHVEFINEQDRTLIMAGHDDGCVRIWQPMAPPLTDDGGAAAAAVEEETPQMLTAWQALHDFRRGAGAGRTNEPCNGIGIGGGSGMVMSWHQRSQLLVVAESVGGGIVSSLGESHMKCWDVATERQLCKMPTGTNAAVTVLDNSAGSYDIQQLVAGFDNGSVRLYDRRLAGKSGASALIGTLHESADRILFARFGQVDQQQQQPQSEQQPRKLDMLVVGSETGVVRLYDVRNCGAGAVLQWQTGPAARPMLHMDVHWGAALVACGGAGSVAVHALDDGRSLNMISTHRYMERAERVSCVAFHPLRVSLAVGYAGPGSVMVYGRNVMY